MKKKYKKCYKIFHWILNIRRNNLIICFLIKRFEENMFYLYAEYNKQKHIATVVITFSFVY